VATAEAELVNDDVGERLHRMERDTEIERLAGGFEGPAPLARMIEDCGQATSICLMPVRQYPP